MRTPVAVRIAVKSEKERSESRSLVRKSLICLVEPNGIEPSTS